MISDLSRKSAFMFSFLMCLLLFFEFGIKHQNIQLLRGEHGLVEIFSGLAYLVAVYFAVKLAIATKGLLKSFFYLWTIFTIVFFGEETSWIQHYLRYPTPSFFADHNAQGELNFHNITTTGGSLINAYATGNFDLSILFKSQNLFNLGFLIYFLILPLSAFLFPSIQNKIRIFSVPTIGINTVLCFWVPIILSLLMALIDLNNETYLRNYVGETREMFYAITIATFLYISWRKLQSRVNT